MNSTCPRRSRRWACATRLSSKAKAGAIVMLDEAKRKDIKTGALAKQFGKLEVGRALVVDGEFDKNFQLSARNLAAVALLPVAGINVYDIMRSDKLVLTTAAVKAIEARLGQGSGGMSINYDVILSPVITEKATRMTEANQVVFRVDAGRHQAGHRQGGRRPVQGQGQGGEHGDRQGQAQAARGKRYTRSDFKKAIVTLEEGHQIDITTGL